MQPFTDSYFWPFYVFDSSCWIWCRRNSTLNANNCWNRRGISLDTCSYFCFGLLETAQSKEVRMSHLFAWWVQAEKPNLQCQARRKSSKRV